MARVLLGRWVEDGWLEVADPSRRARAYVLSASYRQFIGSLSQWAGWVTATSVEADRIPANPVTDHNRHYNQKKRGEHDDPVHLKDVVR